MTDSPKPFSRRDVLATFGAAASAASLWPDRVPAASAELPLSSRELWEWVRAQPLLQAGIAYLDTASTGPALRTALVTEYRNREAINLNYGEYSRSRLSPAAVTQFVQRVATFAGAESDEVTFTTGATESLNLVANGLPLEPGDEIILTTHEHAAHLHAWLLQARRRGLVVKQIAMPAPLGSPVQILEAFTAAITPRTRVLAMSHVLYTDGTVLPVRELCELARSRNIVSVVDGAQAFGMLNVPIRDLGCDFYAASLSKWLNGGLGMGLLYVRSEWLDRLWPLTADGPAGWNEGGSFGLADPADAELRSGWPASLRRFGTNYRSFLPLFQGLNIAFDMQERIGRARIEARIRELALYAQMKLQEIRGISVVTPMHPSLWAGIQSFTIRGQALKPLASALAEKESTVIRHVAHSNIGFEVLRVSAHIYNAHDEIDRLVYGLKQQI
ncbi:MAG: aminotransferase class V-fold PLP-dependent enzyme [Steroidobacteraceae bacterium]